MIGKESQRPWAGMARVDRWAVMLSGLCMAHCVASIVILALLSTAGGILLDPAVHRFGLLLALLLGAAALGSGLFRHRRKAPLALGGTGLALMTAALLVPHGISEALLTIAGAALLAAGHFWNGKILRAPA